MAIWTLAKKELRLFLRDRRAVVILLAMPFIFILILGMSLGEGFGQKPDDRLRVSLVDEDLGDVPAKLREGGSLLFASLGANWVQALGPAALAEVNRADRPPAETWSHVVQRDLAETAEIRVEVIPDRRQADDLIAESKRSAVLVFGPFFSQNVTRTSFLAEGINPFYRDGVKLTELDAVMLHDPT